MNTALYTDKSEAAIIGGVLNFPETIGLTASLLPESDVFSNIDHQKIYDAMLDCYAEKVLPDMTVVMNLVNDQRIDDLLADIAMENFSNANLEYHSSNIINGHMLRQLSNLIGEMQRTVDNVPDVQAEDLLAKINEEAQAIAAGISKQTFSNHKQKIDKLRADLDKPADGTHLVGLSTGLDYLDRMTRGLKSGQLILIAGATSMGKSALAVNFALHAAKREGNVGLFSLEMTDNEQFLRKVAIEASISAADIESRNLDPREKDRVREAADRLENSYGTVFYDDTGGLTIAQISSRARKMKIQHDVKMIIVDYLQLMRVTKGSATQQLGIAEIGRGLKALSKELDIPVIALSQFHRGIENRTNKRPVMSDLRDSGTLEEDADLILFLYREGYYSEDPAEKMDGTTELNVAKQRGGAVGVIYLNFNMETGRFTQNTNQEF